MMKKTLILTAIFLFVAAFPAAAMMGGGHMWQGEQDRGGSSRPPAVNEKTGTGHYHGDYYHEHQKGEIPHTHDEAGKVRKPSAKGKSGSTSSEKARRAAPAAKALPRVDGQSALSHEGAHGVASPPQSQAGANAEHQDLSKGETAQHPPSSEAVLQAAVSGLKIQGKDDMVGHLVPGGTLSLPENTGAEGSREPIEVKPYYMDETHVTNHQYVEFLNRVLPELELENGIVRKGGDVWLYLGEVKEGYEPIVFKDGRFIVGGVHHAACPVLRVTAYGASAYARFYGKRLPTEAEWLHASSAGDTDNSASLPIPSPAIAYPANGYGIRGLSSNIGEWGMKNVGPSSNASGESEEYVILGGFPNNADKKPASSSSVRRSPWEAFGDAGFRCVVGASGQG